MITMRYGTYRRSVLPASGLLGLCFLGMIFFRAESWGVIFEILCWVIGVGGGLFQLVVSALRALGKLEVHLYGRRPHQYALQRGAASPGDEGAQVFTKERLSRRAEVERLGMFSDLYNVNFPAFE